MLKKTITFKDLDGNPVTQDFYFNLNDAELAEMHLSMPGGMEGYLRKIMAEEDAAAIISTFKEILWKAIGRKDADGIRFVKSDEIWFEFSQTDAYSVLFMELLTNAKAAAEFIKGIVPANLAARIPDSGTLELSETRLSGAIFGETQKRKKLEDYTDEELVAMPGPELADLIQRESGNVPKKILLLAMSKIK
jgi:hypothetical protein